MNSPPRGSSCIQNGHPTRHHRGLSPLHAPGALPLLSTNPTVNLLPKPNSSVPGQKGKGTISHAKTQATAPLPCPQRPAPAPSHLPPIPNSSCWGLSSANSSSQLIFRFIFTTTLLTPFSYQGLLCTTPQYISTETQNAVPQTTHN